MRTRWWALTVSLLGSALLVAGADNDCSFLKTPLDLAGTTPAVRYAKRTQLSSSMQEYLSGGRDVGAAVDASAIPRNNTIDNFIFERMAGAGIRSAPLASDAEFLRRVTLDLTGRIPTGADVVAFLEDRNPSKRTQKIESLIGSPQFVDKWTMFFGDLFRNNAQAQNVNRAVPGRDAFYLYIKDAIASNKPYDQMARELIAATGDPFVQGEANFPIGNTVAMGPAQDTYDGHAVNVASMFLGINAVDCLLCHDGRRHLDTVNLWGAEQTRRNMWGLSAYFARARSTRATDAATGLAKFIVSDAPTGEYQLNTTTGNRSARQANGGPNSVAPLNPFNPTAGAGVAAGETRRQAIARQLTADLQFSRAIVNYVWEELMVEAFVSPSNAFDLARLDPDHPPAAPWTLQPTNPRLLNSLAVWFQQNGYDLRALISLIAQSNAYQLSSVYPGTWDSSYVPYYARKYIRRLDAEEIHDAIVLATGVVPTYTIQGSALPAVQWAMQLPDTREPRTNNGAATFLNAFGRGDRDTTVRRSDGSLLQALSLMNNAFVDSRIGPNNAGSRVQWLIQNNASADTVIRELFVNTLSRQPSAVEMKLFLNVFEQQPIRTAAENVQWVLLNKMDFLFNY